MSRYIDADKLKEECYKFANDVSRSAMAFAQGQINAAPTADVEEVRHGHWIEHSEKPAWLEDDVEVFYNCSECGTSHWSIVPPFCPECGAKMDERREE